MAKAAKIEPKRIEILDPKSLEAKETCPLSGSKNPVVMPVLARQLAGAVWTKHSDEEATDKQYGAAMVQAMGIRPQDEMEGMLGAQMVACHNAAMECYRRAMIGEQTFEGRSDNLNQANKLSRTYGTLLESLSRYRGKGQQKVTVEHVHVHAGGQAIVGHVEQTGGGSNIKTKDQAHAANRTALPDLTGQEQLVPWMRSEDEKREAVPVAPDA